MKIALVTNIIPPYREPLFNAIGSEVDLTVIISSLMEPDRKWQPWKPTDNNRFKTILLKGVGIETRRGIFYLQPDLLKVLWRSSFDVVISSGFNLNSLAGALYGRVFKKRTLLWSEATCHSEQKRWPALFRKLYRKMLIHLNDGFIPSGCEAKKFLLSLGTVGENCFTAVDAVELIREPDYQRLKEQAASMRLKLPGTILLYSGRVSKTKGVHHLVEAYKIISRIYETSLIIMGSGALEQELQHKVEKEHITNVHFVGYQNETDKWKYYLASDVFVFPTEHDVWGFVVNEAMLCGLPVICSCFAGAAADLVEDCVNGYVVNPFNADELVTKITNLLENQCQIKAMGQQSLKKISSYSIKNSAKGFIEAIHGRR